MGSYHYAIIIIIFALNSDRLMEPPSIDSLNDYDLIQMVGNSLIYWINIFFLESGIKPHSLDHSLLHFTISHSLCHSLAIFLNFLSLQLPFAFPRSLLPSKQSIVISIFRLKIIK